MGILRRFTAELLSLCWDRLYKFTVYRARVPTYSATAYFSYNMPNACVPVWNLGGYHDNTSHHEHVQDLDMFGLLCAAYSCDADV